MRHGVVRGAKVVGPVEPREIVLGDTLVAAMSALVLDYFYLPPIYDLNPGQDALLTAAFLAVALVVKRLNDHLRDGERAAAQLEGIRLASTEIGDRLGNRLAVAAGSVELLAASERLSPDQELLAERARAALFAAAWLWSLASSLQLRRESRAHEQRDRVERSHQ